MNQLEMLAHFLGGQLLVISFCFIAYYIFKINNISNKIAEKKRNEHSMIEKLRRND